jgi:hypothetical protein
MKKIRFIVILFNIYSLQSFAQNSIGTQSIQNDFQNYVNTESARNYTGSFLPVFTTRENTVGSRYLYDKWVSGSVTNMDNVIVTTDSFLFNYDKIAGKLLATKDGKHVIEVNDAFIKSFTLVNGNDSVMFEQKLVSSDREFLIGLVSNKNGYSLYKLIQSKFERANYTTNGIIESGKKYDEYIDVPVYYIAGPGGKEFKKIALKRKALKEALPAEAEKVKKYFSKNEDDAVNENFLIGLTKYLNQ